MRWYFSYPVLAAGLVFGGHIFLPKDHTRSRAVEVVTIAPAADVVDAATTAFAMPSRLAAFAPDSRLFAVHEPKVADARPHTSVLDYLASALTSETLTPVSTAPVAPELPVTAPEWKSAVVLDVQTAAPEAVAENRPTLSPRISMTRDIQRELKRVGCYLGEIDGVWGSGSKRAIVMFMDRVNASLPMQEPDVFMLSLLRAEDVAVCGPSCPSGQSLTGGGRCVPSTLMAQGERSGERPQRTAYARSGWTSPDGEPDRSFEATSAASSPERIAARRPPLAGRMAIGGPKPPADSDPVPPTPVLERTAALAPSDEINESSPRVALPVARATSFDSNEVVERRVRVTASRPRAAQRPVQRRVTNYRHVQRLFEHPLGRM